MDRSERYIRRLSALEGERLPFDSDWQEISNYLLPGRGRFAGYRPNQGEKKPSLIIDGTGTRAIRILAAGMQGGLTSPARPWFRLGLPDADLVEFGPVREWLNAVERQMYNAFARSNFYHEIHVAYADLAAYGISCLYEEEDPDKLIRFRVLQPGEYCAAVNSRWIVETLYRKLWMTAEQIVEQFGADAPSPAVREAAEKNPDSWYEVLHVVTPRKQRDSRKVDNLNMPWESVYIEIGGDKKILGQSGYHEFPCMVPRWDLASSDIYGRSPAMDTLGDVKSLQAVQRSTLEALQKIVNPPMNVGASQYGRLSLVPGAVNIVEDGNTDTVRPTFPINYDVRGSSEKARELQVAIREAFYNDLFLMIANSDTTMTATEVAERHEEKLLMLGPVIERQQSELLNPIIDRTFAILWRAGRIPPPPEDLAGMELKVEYISLLAQAQKLVGTQAINATMQFVVQTSAVNPEVLDKVDFDEAVDQFADMTGAPAKMIRADDAVAEIRAARQQQKQATLAAQEGMVAVEGAKGLSQAKMNPDDPNALTELMSSMEGI